MSGVNPFWPISATVAGQLLRRLWVQEELHSERVEVERQVAQAPIVWFEGGMIEVRPFEEDTRGNPFERRKEAVKK